MTFVACASSAPLRAERTQPVEPDVLRVLVAADDGPGSLRAALEAANASERPVRIEIALERGTVIEILAALPPLRAPGATLEGGGAILVSHPDCERPDGRFGCDGLVVRGPDITVRDLVARGFLFDGIAVRGPAARGVLVRGCTSVGNSDDGFGISDGATEVEIRDSVAMDNGYRTKGKGILVFDDARATLVGNLLIGNRDGLTVSRRAHATVIDTAVVGSFDKGVGVAGATLAGIDNLVASNGLGGDEPAPNADGLRATLASRVVLQDTKILDNGDTGVVALSDSEIDLVGGQVIGNRRYGVAASTGGTVRLWGTGIALSGAGESILLDDSAVIARMARDGDAVPVWEQADPAQAEAPR